MTTKPSAQADQQVPFGWFTLYATDPEQDGVFRRFFKLGAFAEHTETYATSHVLVLYTAPIVGLASRLEKNPAPAKLIDDWASEALAVLKLVRPLRTRCLMLENPSTDEDLERVKEKIAAFCPDAPVPNVPLVNPEYNTFGAAVAHLAMGYHSMASSLLSELQASTTGPVRDSFGDFDACLSAMIAAWPDTESFSAKDVADRLATQVLELEDALRSTETEKRRIKRELTKMLNSKSWRITKPVRLVLKRLKR